MGGLWAGTSHPFVSSSALQPNPSLGQELSFRVLPLCIGKCLVLFYCFVLVFFLFFFF